MTFLSTLIMSNLRFRSHVSLSRLNEARTYCAEFVGVVAAHSNPINEFHKTDRFPSRIVLFRFFKPLVAVSSAVSSPRYRPGRIGKSVFLATVDQVPSVARISCNVLSLSRTQNYAAFSRALRLIKERKNDCVATDGRFVEMFVEFGNRIHHSSSSNGKIAEIAFRGNEKMLRSRGRTHLK
jgi:hypothetical protein